MLALHFGTSYLFSLPLAPRAEISKLPATTSLSATESPFSLPPPLDGVPTDAEVALELISRRVAQGLPVLPQKRHTHRSPSATSLPGSPDVGSPSSHSISGEDKKFTWSKLGDRVAEGKNLADTAKRFVTNKTVSGSLTEYVSSSLTHHGRTRALRLRPTRRVSTGPHACVAIYSCCVSLSRTTQTWPGAHYDHPYTPLLYDAALLNTEPRYTYRGMHGYQEERDAQGAGHYLERTGRAWQCSGA